MRAYCSHKRKTEAVVRTNENRARRGLTLIELVVVLAILITLAGILVPKLKNYFSKGHGTGGATNIAEIAKYWELYRVDYGSYAAYPDQLDNLVDSGGTLYNNAGVSYLSTPPTMLTNTALTGGATGTAAALNNLGLLNLWVPTTGAQADVTNPTGTLTPVAAGQQVATLVTTDALSLENLNGWGQTAADIAGSTYFVFGIGSHNTGNGNVMLEAPTHISDNSGADPTSIYNRFYVVYRVTTAAYAGGPKVGSAKFLGVLGSEGDGLYAHINIGLKN